MLLLSARVEDFFRLTRDQKSDLTLPTPSLLPVLSIYLLLVSCPHHSRACCFLP